MTLWLLDSLLSAEEESFLLEHNVITLSSPLPDLTASGSEFALRHQIKELFPDETPERIAIDAERLWKFVDLMLPEDIVAVVCGRGKSLRLAEVTAAYYYDAEAPETLHHLKPVRWLSTEPLYLPDLLNNYEPPQRPRLLEITDEKQKDRILAPAGLSRSFMLRYIPLAVAGILGIRMIFMLIDNLRSAGIF